MQQQTRRQAKELLDTQLNVNASDISRETYSTELITREEIPGTPFTVIGVLPETRQSDDAQQGQQSDGLQQEQGRQYFGTLGRYRITENKATKEQIQEELRQFSWDLLLKILGIIVPSEIERAFSEMKGSNNEVDKQQHTTENTESYQQ